MTALALDGRRILPAVSVSVSGPSNKIGRRHVKFKSVVNELID